MSAKFLISSLAALTVVIVFTFYGPVLVDQALAQVGGTAVSGYGWSSNIGWVQMNTGQQSPVTVDVVGNTGTFKGYGWSSNVGWLQFNPTGTYPTTPSHGVQIDLTTNKLSGWARFLANGGGWDGWVNFNDVTYDPAAKKFNGYAWGADVVGWLDMSTAFVDLTSTTTPPTCPEEYNGNCTCSNPDWATDNPSSCEGNPPTEYTLTLHCIGGVITRDGVEICKDQSGATETIDPGDVVSLVTRALTNYQFESWSGACTSTNADGCSFTMNGNKTVTALFSTTGEPSVIPFTIESNIASCRATDGALCRITVDCSTTDVCKNGYYSVRKAIVHNNVANTPSGLTISIAQPPSTAGFLLMVLCTTEDINSCQSGSLSAYTGTYLYVRMLVDTRAIGEQRVFDVNLSAPASADYDAKTEKIRGTYRDPVIITPNSVQAGGQ